MSRLALIVRVIYINISIRVKLAGLNRLASMIEVNID